MTCDEVKALLSGYLDEELASDQQAEVEEHLRACPACAADLAGLAGLKEELSMMKFREPTDEELERYWHSVYNRLERGVGWVLFSVGAILVLCYGAFKLIEETIRDPNVATVLKVGMVALVFGAVVLFVSLLRERLAVRRADRYSREVER